MTYKTGGSGCDLILDLSLSISTRFGVFVPRLSFFTLFFYSPILGLVLLSPPFLRLLPHHKKCIAIKRPHPLCRVFQTDVLFHVS